MLPRMLLAVPARLARPLTRPLVVSTAALAVAMPAAVASATPGGGADAPAPSSPQVAPKVVDRKERVRVITYNIRYAHRGIQRIAEDIEKTNAEVVLLEEVDDRRPTGGKHQSVHLGKMLDMNVHFDRNGRTKHGWRGNAILSKYPLRDLRRWDIPKLKGRDVRGLMGVTADIGKRSMRLYVTHLDPRRGRLAQAKEIRRIIGKPDCSTVLGGDMNTEPGSWTYNALNRDTADVWPLVGQGPGYTSYLKTKRIDYLFHSHAAPATGWVAPLRHSDHRALIGNFDLRDANSC